MSWHHAAAASWLSLQQIDLIKRFSTLLTFLAKVVRIQ